MPPPFILGLKNILDRNDKSELVPHLENSVRIIISWSKRSKSIFKKDDMITQGKEEL